MYDQLNDDIVESPLRDYTGLSIIGNKCYRFLQYNHYWCFNQKITKRIDRLFNVGKNAEPAMIYDLAQIGLVISMQQAEVVGFAGHWKGHIDGLVHNVKDYDAGDRLWEAKTHNEKSFHDLKKKGMKESKPVHYSQMISYMGYLDLSEGLYHALNKNTSEYYFESVTFDIDHFNDLKVKESDIILTDGLFPRIGNNSKAWFECKFCDARKVCFKSEPIHKSCRSCMYVESRLQGTWHCTNKNAVIRAGRDSTNLNAVEQSQACDYYKLYEIFE